MGARANRFDTRLTWVSTGIVGFSAQKSRTTSAVLGPTPGSSISVFLASSKGIDKIGFKSPRNLSRIFLEACFIVLVLFLYRPVTFKHSSILLVSTFANASGIISNCFERFSKALIVFLSVMFYEIIVVINALKGFLFDVVHLGSVKVFRRVFAGFPLFDAQPFIASPFENNK